MILCDSQEQLLMMIENKRSEMVLAILETGILSYKTIKTSQELDHLLNQLQNRPKRLELLS